MNFCLNPNSYSGDALIKSIGEKAAYHVTHLNNGHSLERSPSGKESNLFNEIVRYTGDYDKAFEMKAKFYTKRFRDTYGDWLKEDRNNIENTDSNGEPLFSHYIDKLDADTVVSNKLAQHEESPRNNQYEANKSYYTPILDKLQDSFGLKWEENDQLTQPAAYQDGKISVNFSRITPDSAFHEYGHPIILFIKNGSPAAYNRLVAEAHRHPEVVQSVKDSYRHLSPSELNDEIVTTVLGNYAKEAHTVMQKKGLVAAIRQFFDSISKTLSHILGLKTTITRGQLETLTLREMGFLVGTSNIRLDLKSVNDTFENLKKKGVVVGDKVRLELSDYSLVKGYQDLFGPWNVDIIKSPKGDTGAYTVEIENPISTKGQQLFRMKSKAEGGDEPKYKTTENEFLDKMVKVLDEKINVLRNDLKGKLDKSDQLRYSRDVRFYAEAISEFYRLGTVQAGVKVIGSEIKRLDRLVDTEMRLSEISSAIKMLNGFDIVDTYVNKFNSSGTLLDNVKAIKADISALRNRFVAKHLETFKKDAIEMGVSETVANTLAAANDISGVTLNTLGSSFAQNSFEQAGDYIIRKGAYDGNEESRAFNTKISEMAEKFRGQFGFMLTKDDNGSVVPISKMNKKFLDTMNNIRSGIGETSKATVEHYKEIRDIERKIAQSITNGDPKSVQEGLYAEKKAIENKVLQIRMEGKTWNDYHRFLQDHFDYVLTEEKEAEYREFIKEHAENFIDIDENGKEVFNEKGYRKAVHHYDPANFKAYLEGKRKTPNAGAQWFTMVPKAGSTAKLYSAEYKSLTAEQKEFYDFFTESFYEVTQTMHRNEAQNEDLNMDAAIRNFTSMPDEQREKMKYSEAVKEWMKELVSVPGDKAEMDTNGVFSGLANKNIRFRNVQEFIDPKKGLNEQNIVEVLKKYHAAGVAYQYKKKVEDTLNAVAEIAFAAGKKDVSNSGANKKDLFGDDKTVPATSNIYKRLRHIVDNHLYSDTKENMLNGKIGNTPVSGDKIIDMINEFTRLRQMGFNPFSGISNLGMGTINNWTYAKRDEFFSEKDLRRAYWRLKSSFFKSISADKIESAEAKKIALLAAKFGIHDTLMEKHAKSKFFDKAYMFQERGEYMNQMAIVLAVIDGNKVGTFKDKSGNEKTLFDVFKVKGDALELDTENFSEDQLPDNKKIFNIVQGVLKINKEIHGDYDPLNPMYMKRTSIGRLLSTFRTWLPQAVLQRFGSERRDEQLSAMAGEDVYRMGRYRSVARAFSDKSELGWQQTALQMVGHLAAGFVPGIKGSFNELGGLGKNDIANINQTLSEMRIMIVIGLLVAAMGSMHDDDDDKKNQKVFNFFYNMSNRMENELAFFYYPTSGYKLFKDFIPAIDTFTQMGNVAIAAKNKVLHPDKDTYVRGFRKGTSKLWKETQILMPGLKQVQSAWSVVSQQYGNTNYNK